jgi:hypothetical protein
MHKSVIDFLNTNSILTEEHFGFWKGLSPDKVLYIYIDKILSYILRVISVIVELAVPSPHYLAAVLMSEYFVLFCY